MTALALWLALQDEGYRQALSEVARRVRESTSPSVVAVLIRRSADPEGLGPRGHRAEHSEYYSRPKGYCTATVLTSDGLLATSAFNVSGELEGISVLVEGHDAAYDARLVGTDREKDVALLRIDPAEPLRTLARADVSGLGAGTFAFVIGRAPDPASPTINGGIVSAVRRFGGSHVQTDAELNYGNVGGPLVDARGRLIGVTTHIHPNAHWGQSGGVGFAIRHDELDRLARKIEAGGVDRKPAARRVTLGIVPAPGARDIEGVQVAEVLAGSAAEAAGILEGDLLVELDGSPVRSPSDLAKALEGRRAGDRVKVRVRRADANGRSREFEVDVDLIEDTEY